MASSTSKLTGPGLGQEARLSEILSTRKSNNSALPSVKDGAIPTPGGSPDIYNLNYNGEMPNPWELHHIGLLINYLSVGIIKGASAALIYPIVVVMNNEEPSVVSSSKQLVSLWWSYKIFFGILTDCFPIFGFKRKPYMFGGWLITALIFVALAVKTDVSASTLVVMLSLACFSYVAADVAGDGYTVMMAQKEPMEKRGNVQSMIYIARFCGEAIATLLVGFTFSGPRIMCSGYKSSADDACEGEMPEGYLEEPVEDWCHEKCLDASFNFDITISSLAWILVAASIVGVPFYYLLAEERSVRSSFRLMMKNFWVILQKKAVWQIILYTVNSTLFMAVGINAKDNTNDAWLKFSPIQNSVLSVMDLLVLSIGLYVVKRWFINSSWRNLIIYGTVLQTFFGALYLLIVYNVWRNSYFYMFTDVTAYFVSTLNFIVGVLYIVEVSEPGYEAITYSLITTAHNTVLPLGTVMSNQISGWFALTVKDIGNDDAYVRNQFFYCWLLTTVINMLSLLTLPLLPRQKKEARDLLAAGETSKGWAITVIVFVFVTMIYSSIANFATLDKTLKCHKVLGGRGCTTDESPAFAYFLVAIYILFVVVTTFWVGYLPAIRNRKL